MKHSKKKQVDGSYDVQEAIDLGVNVIVEELIKIRQLAKDSDEPLDPEYTTQITKYVNTLITVGKDHREQAAATDLTQLSDEELDKLTRAALGDEPDTN